MSLVGPLANPAMAGRQVVGVADARRLALIAGGLRELGATHAMIVHGAGMDEISPFGPTQVFEIRNGGTSEWTIEPREFGFGEGAPQDLAGGPPAENASAVLRVLRGEGNAASTAAVVLNAAAAFYVGGKAATFREGVEIAREAVTSGAGLLALEKLRASFAKR
jgi:anthranilate phosphoribosyltransferase